MGGELDLIRSVSFIKAYSGCEDAEVKSSDYRLEELLMGSARGKEGHLGCSAQLSPPILTSRTPNHPSVLPKPKQ